MVTWAFGSDGHADLWDPVARGQRDLPKSLGRRRQEKITISVAQECQTINIKIAARILLCRSRLQIDLRTSLRAPSEYPRDTHAVFRGELLSEKRTFGIVKRHGEVSRQTDN